MLLIVTDALPPCAPPEKQPEGDNSTMKGAAASNTWKSHVMLFVASVISDRTIGVVLAWMFEGTVKAKVYWIALSEG